MKIVPNRHKNAIGCGSMYGPTFGKNKNGQDIHISSNANSNNGSHSRFGHTYKHPQYAKWTNEAQSFLAGTYNIPLSEIEVYQKE